MQLWADPILHILSWYGSVYPFRYFYFSISCVSGRKRDGLKCILPHLELVVCSWFYFIVSWWKYESESEVAQSCPTLCDPMDCSPPGSSVHGILQARILEWVAISSPGDLQTQGLNPGLWHWRQTYYRLSHGEVHKVGYFPLIGIHDRLFHASNLIRKQGITGSERPCHSWRTAETWTKNANSRTIQLPIYFGYLLLSTIAWWAIPLLTFRKD